MEKYLEIEDGFVEDGKFYFIERSSLCIFFVDLITGRIVHFTNIPIRNMEYCVKKNIYGKGIRIRKWKNKIIAFSGIDQSLFIYSEESQNWTSEEIEFEHNIEEFHRPYFCMEIYDDKIYLFGCLYRGIIIYDLITGKYNEIMYTFDFNCVNGAKRYLLRYGCMRKEKVIYGLSDFNDKLMKFYIDEEIDKWEILSDNYEIEDLNILNEMACTHIKYDKCLYWYKDSEYIIFQDFKKLIHCIRRDTHKEKCFSNNIELNEWKNCFGRYLLQKTIEAGSIVKESEEYAFRDFMSLIQN